METRLFGTSLLELLAPSLAWIWSGELGAGNREGGKADTSDTQEKKGGKKGKEEKEKKRKKAEEEAKKRKRRKRR